MFRVAQGYDEFTSNALEYPLAWAEQGHGGVGFELDGTHHDGGDSNKLDEMTSTFAQGRPNGYCRVRR